jgi:hypothetical protein
MTTAAKVTVKVADLASDFGFNLFMRKAGAKADELLASLPKYVRGPKTGKPKGFICWLKVESGGWDFVYGNGVQKPGTSFGYKLASSFGEATHYTPAQNEPLQYSRDAKARCERELEEELAKLESWQDGLEHRTERYKTNPSESLLEIIEDYKQTIQKTSAKVEHLKSRLQEISANCDLNLRG